MLLVAVADADAADGTVQDDDDDTVGEPTALDDDDVLD